MDALVTIFSLIGRVEGLSDHLCVSMMGGLAPSRSFVTR